MINLGYADLDRLIEKGLSAREFAWEHYDMLAAREAKYTFYGPAEYYLGAASPSHLAKAKRKLLTKTRRERYNKYELDANHQLIRVTHVYQNDKIENVHYVFQLDGILYGYPFFQGKKCADTNRVEAIKIAEGKAVYYVQTSDNYMYGEFYEYPSSDKRIVTSYLYSRSKEERLVPVSWDVPCGAPNSPASMHVCEDAPRYIDFSRWPD